MEMKITPSHNKKDKWLWKMFNKSNTKIIIIVFYMKYLRNLFCGT